MVPVSKWVTHKDARALHGPSMPGHWDIMKAGGADTDISIIVLARNVKFTSHIQPICLPSKPDQEYSEMEMYVSGWGNTQMLKNQKGEINGHVTSDVPKRAKLIGISARNCRRRYKIDCDFCGKRTMLCAYGAKQYNRTINEDSCGGDSGGNIIYYV